MLCPREGFTLESEAMPEDTRKIEAWIRFGQPLDTVIDDYPRIFDAWEVIGVRGIVVGRMLVRNDASRNEAIFDENRTLPEGFELPRGR